MVHTRFDFNNSINKTLWLIDSKYYWMIFFFIESYVLFIGINWLNTCDKLCFISIINIGNFWYQLIISFYCCFVLLLLHWWHKLLGCKDVGYWDSLLEINNVVKSKNEPISATCHWSNPWSLDDSIWLRRRTASI